MSDRVPCKLHLGCGHRILDGFINIDLHTPVADIKRDITDLSCFEDNSVDEIYMNAVFEHLYAFQQMPALCEWYRVLKPGGVIIMTSTPDFDEIAKAYVNRAPGNSSEIFDLDQVMRYTHGAYGEDNKLGQMHKDIFTKGKLRQLFQDAGFEIQKIESVCWGNEPNPVNIDLSAMKPIVARTTGDRSPSKGARRSVRSRRTTNQPTLAAVYCVYDDDTWLPDSLESIYSECDAIYFLVSDTPWYGPKVDNTSTLRRIEALADPDDKIEIVRGSWSNETDQRNAGLDTVNGAGYTHCLVIDADEIYDPADLRRMMDLVAQNPGIDCWHVSMDTYWKTWQYKISPREPLKPVVFVKARSARFTNYRAINGRNPCLIPTAVGVCHHMSYARTDEQVLRKITTFSHAHEILPGWYENVWKRWTPERPLKDLHPTHPHAYRRSVLQPYWSLPPVLKRRCTGEHIGSMGRTSIVVLTYNQIGFTRQCLDSIVRNTSMPYELIVVDNASTDGTAEYLKEFADRAPNVKIVLNESNLGFALGNNQGIDRAEGEYVLLVNNDVVVTPGWIERLLHCADRDDDTGIVGPVTNCISGIQQIEEPGYNTDTLEGLDVYAADWADQHSGEAMETWRIVGFCMLIKRAVIDRIGGLDGIFGRGNFEDDDFCIRSAIAGFRSVVARDCLVHHFGSRSFDVKGTAYSELLHRNWGIFKHKWGLSPHLQYGASCDISALWRSSFDPNRHYCPVAEASPAGDAGACMHWFAAPSWDRSETWTPVLEQFIGSHSSGDGSLLVLHAGPLTQSDEEHAYAQVERFLVGAGIDPDSIPDVEIGGELPSDDTTCVILTGGPIDENLKAKYRRRCVDPASITPPRLTAAGDKRQ